MKLSHYTRALKRLWQTRAFHQNSSYFFIRAYNGFLNAVSWWPSKKRCKLWPVKLRGYGYPLYVRQGSSDWTVFDEIFCRDEYATVYVHLDKADIRTVVDLGCNAGYSLVEWLRQFPNLEHILAVDLDADNLRVSKANCEPHTKADVITYFEGAVTAKPERVAIDRSLRQIGYRVRPSDSPESASSENRTIVESKTLDQILETTSFPGKIDLLKCDIEGAEIEAFKHCSNWISGVQYLVVELHRGYSAQSMAKDIRDCGSHATILWSEDKGRGMSLALMRLSQIQDNA